MFVSRSDLIHLSSWLKALLQVARQIVLVIVGVLTSVVSLFYYLRIPMVMYMREPAADADPDSPGFFERVVLVTCVIATIFLGILPQLGDLGLLDDAGTAVQQLAQLR